MISPRNIKLPSWYRFMPFVGGLKQLSAIANLNNCCDNKTNIFYVYCGVLDFLYIPYVQIAQPFNEVISIQMAGPTPGKLIGDLVAGSGFDKFPDTVIRQQCQPCGQ